MKRLLLLGFLALQSALSAFDGFYVGGRVGGSALVGDQRGNLEADLILTPLPASLDADFFDFSQDGSLFVGYGFQWGCFYTGLEGFVRYSPHKVLNRIDRDIFISAFPVALEASDNNQTQIETGPWHFGVDWRAGFLLAPHTLIYGRLGVDWSSVEVENREDFIAFGSALAIDDQFFPFFISHQNEKRAHLRWGLGIEKSLNSCFSLSLDYIYTRYGRYSFSNARAIPIQFLSISDQAKINLEEHAASVGLIYHFHPRPLCPTTCCTSPCFTGFYLGGSLGGSLAYSNVNRNFAAEVTGAETESTFSFDESTTLVNRGFIGFAALGYSLRCKDIYLAVEAFAQYRDRLNKKTTTNDRNFATGIGEAELFSEVKAEINPWEYGVNFRPGFFLTPSTLIFASIGTSRATVKGQSTSTLFSPRDILLTTQSEREQKRWTLRYGAGLEYALCSSFHLRADYIYTDYGRFHFDREEGGSFDIETLSLRDQTKLEFHAHALTLGIFTYF